MYSLALNSAAQIRILRTSAKSARKAMTTDAGTRPDVAEAGDPAARVRPQCCTFGFFGALGEELF
jgi:hypothetical protein